jgi:hypothetical protein
MLSAEYVTAHRIGFEVMLGVSTSHPKARAISDAHDSPRA